MTGADPLVAHRWIAPAVAGPTMRRAALVAAAVGVLLGLWLLVGMARLHDWLAGSDRATARIVITDSGGMKASAASVDVGGASLRTAGSTQYVAARATLAPESRRTRLVVTPPDGVSVDDVVVRVVPRSPGPVVRTDRSADGVVVDLERASGTLDVLVTTPARLLAKPPTGKPDGVLRDVTDPLDERAAHAVDDAKLLNDMRGVWLPAVATTLLGVLVLMWRWWRDARSFRSMRVPGSGIEPTTAIPSSLDPLVVTILAAGTGPIDAADAFAARVVDLIERRQLQLRRTSDLQSGVGSRLGLAHAMEGSGGVADDPAVAVLRSAADADGLTVTLRDVAGQTTRTSAHERQAWAQFARDRARFERVIEVAPRWRRQAYVAMALGAVSVVAILLAIVRGGPGHDARVLLVAAVAGSLAVVLGAWTRDAYTWRRVTRGRRLERAQWLGWAAHVRDGSVDGSAVADPRDAPLLIAVGSSDLLPSSTGPDAIGVRAVTPATVAALRELLGPCTIDAAHGGTLWPWLPRRRASAHTSRPAARS